jgi:DNA-binding Lrp family transcriptional regulator
MGEPPEYVIPRRSIYLTKTRLGIGEVMGTKAYLLVETAVGKTRDVASTLRSLEGITSVDVVTGPYDIIAIISGTDMAVVGNIVTEKIHTVPGVVRTVTCVAVGA